MRKTAKKGAKTFGIFAYILFLCLIVGGVFALFIATDGLQNGFKAFYVVVNNEIVREQSAGVVVDYGSSLRIDCKYVLQNVDGDNENYKKYQYEVIPFVLEGNDFYFSVNGEEIQFSKQMVLTDGFDIEEHDGYFLLHMQSKMDEILSRVYVGDVEISALNDFSADYYFALKIYSYDSRVSVIVPFRYSFGDVNLIINKGEVVF